MTSGPPAAPTRQNGRPVSQATGTPDPSQGVYVPDPPSFCAAAPFARTSGNATPNG